MNIFNYFIQHNIIAIIYFNFKMLPFRQAIKLPFDFYYKVRFENLHGKIRIDASHIQRAMIRIGGRGSDMFPHNPFILDLQGKIIFHGKTEIGCSSYIHVGPKGTLEFGNHVRIGALNKIYCEETIIFNNEIDFSWECQIFDTNFHYIKDIKSNTVNPINSPIKIGSYNWFGNRCNIMKGTITPNNTIVASNSLCNKDYSDIPEYSLLAGSPAKLKNKGIKRLFEGIDI